MGAQKSENLILSPGGLTVITTHFNPDYDAVASMVAARKLYPNALMIFPGGSEKNLRHFFIQSLIHLVGPAKIRDVDLSQVARLVVVDTRQPSRIGPLVQVLRNPGLDIHLYDHHPDAPNDLKGSLEVVAEVGATVTLLTEILARRRSPLLPAEATMMAVGIYEDTGSFTFHTTTPRDYLAAAALLEQGADLTVVSQVTVRELTAVQLALLNELISSAETRQARGLNFVIATAQVEEYVEDVAVLAHKMVEILGLSILFVLVGMENKVQLVIRSRLGTVNAAEIAREFGGGGHASAAAASIRNMGLNEAKTRLEEILSEALGQFYLARNIMVYPPISVRESQTLSEARDLMVKYSINVLLVLAESGEEIAGFISEHNVSKALYHGLPDYPVSAFMNSEFASVAPEATFAEIKEIIVDRKQRILPVVEDGRAVGVITRTDLLQILAGAGDLGVTSPTRKTSTRRNLGSLMREKLPPDIFDFLARLGQVADRQNVSLYAVGGFVRDLIMRNTNHDIDLTMDGDINAFAAEAAQVLKARRTKIHSRFKTATLDLTEGYSVDISTTRLEYYEHPGALPTVQKGSIQLDLYRRDFTINSLALSLNAGNFGELFDYYRGYQDIKDGYIRVLHNLSFVEDPTRAFRAVRFEARLGFKMSKMTLSLLEGAVKSNFLISLDPRRLLNELKLILGEEDPGPALERLSELGLLKYIHPHIALSSHHAALFKKIRKVRDWLALTFSEKLSSTWMVYFMALTDGFSQMELAALVDFLALGKKETQSLCQERTLVNSILTRYKKSSGEGAFKPSTACKIFTGLSWPTILFIMAKTENDELSRAGVNFLTSYRQVKPLLSGRDLLRLGLSPGPQLQEALGALRQAHLDGLVATRENEENFIKKRWLKAEG